MNELKLIKDKYGENMSRLCRRLFSTILDNHHGLLLKLLLEHFDCSHFLYDDIVVNQLENSFKDYIYSFVILSKPKETLETRSPKELLKKAGYTLYECLCEKDIQTFRKYYAPDELICTIKNGERLNKCVVFFAVKDNVDEIKRKDFANPKRQDEYGTSVISIQFTKDSSHTLSIKNRYNHTVSDPDATFSNDLDNIVAGLTESFAVTHGLKQKNSFRGFDIPGYIMARDGRYYRYNFERGNIYYCINNIIIDNFDEPHKFPKEQYIIVENYVIDLQSKEITLYDHRIDNSDSFIDSIGKIKNIRILKKNNGNKDIVISPFKGDDIIIEMDKYSKIISYKNKNIHSIGDDFMVYNKSMEGIELPNVKSIGDSFLYFNVNLKSIKLPNVEIIGDFFLCNNMNLESIKLLNVKIIGSFFLANSVNLKSIELPSVKKISWDFLSNNVNLKSIKLPNVEDIEEDFLYCNKNLESIELPNVENIEEGFLASNQVLTTIEAPKLPLGFIFSNEDIQQLYNGYQKKR